MNPEDIGLTPRDLADADHMDRIDGEDGWRYYVIESALTGEKDLVHADCVEYDRLDHPALTGLIGFLTVLFSFLAPPFLVVVYGQLFFDSTGGLALTGLTAVIVAWACANYALNHTAIGDQVYRFLEWNEHKTLIMHGRKTS